MRYEGYHEALTLPIKSGDTVEIPKGVVILSTHPQYKQKVAGRTYRVKVSHILSGSGLPMFTDGILTGNTVKSNPKVVWAGAGGYWHEVDINDVQKVE